MPGGAVDGLLLVHDEIAEHEQARGGVIGVERPDQFRAVAQDAPNLMRDGLAVLGADVAAAAEIRGDGAVGGTVRRVDLAQHIDGGLQAGGGRHGHAPCNANRSSPRTRRAFARAAIRGPEPNAPVRVTLDPGSRCARPG